MGKIGVLVSLESNADKSALKKLGKELAMHIAATSPSSISVNDLSPDIVERERSVLIDQAMSSGKPEDIAKKMVEGRLKKFYSEVVLLEQTFVMDGETKVVDAITKLSKELGADIQIKNFIRFNLGEGIEKDKKILLMKWLSNYRINKLIHVNLFKNILSFYKPQFLMLNETKV